MNLQKLQHMAANTGTITDSDLAELRQLISAYPFYALPHVVLAKVYYEKEHYLFENALTQAAMRVDDREWLYGYIHGNENTGEGLSTGTFVAPAVEAVIAEEISPEPEVFEEPVASALSPEVSDIAERDEAVEDGLLNDINAFLGDLNIAEKEPVAEEIIEEQPEIAPEPDEQSAPEAPVYDEEPYVEGQVVENGSIIRPDTDEAITEVEAIIETEASEEFEAATHEVSFPDINLRKHPVYNVEEFLEGHTEENTAEKQAEDGSRDFFYWLSHPKAKEETPTPKAETAKEAEAEPPAAEEDVSHTPDTKTANDRLSIIDQFIKANPSISRPKREFYNAENMARRSESPDFEFVSETLANIYYEQGNTDMAIKAYEKLSLQNPLKQAYFASLIEKIKKEKR